MSSKQSKNAGPIIETKLKVVIISIVAVIVVAIIGLVAIEGINTCRIKIANHTDKNITNLKVMFETEDESLEMQNLFEGELKSGAKYSGSYDSMNFTEEPGDIGMLVTFEGEDEIYVYDGYFYDRFNGLIDIDFHQAEGEYRVTISASSGIFKNTDGSAIDDDEIYFDFEKADWDIVGSPMDDDELYFDDDGLYFEDIDEDEDWDIDE